MPKRSKIDNEVFVRVWLEAFDLGRDLQYIADKLEVSKNYVSIKSRTLRNMGVELPNLYKTTPEIIDNLNEMITRHQPTNLKGDK